MSELNICSKCQKPKSSSGSGIVTQFIEICRCHEQSAEQSQTITICIKCSKRIAKNSGSMTQWIFGRGKCECDKPEPQFAPIEQFVKPSFVGFRDSSKETYLDLESGKFPIERYLPITELGKGAAGIVYLCRDKILGKKVAVKTLLDLTPEQLISFQDEAKATAKLDHPSIVKVLDFGASESGTPYMVMEFIPGISLENYLSENSVLGSEKAITVFSKLAEALIYAHKQKVFHRDIKPSNILLFEKNEEVDVCLIDFGVAKVKEATGLVTSYQKKTLAGTPSYMSPDTVNGEDYDTQSEIYCLGCVLFEALTGKPPFDGDTALEILAKHSTHDVPHFDNESNSTILDSLEEITRRCLQKSKKDRYQTLEDLISDFKNIDLEEKKNSQTSVRSKPKRKLIIAIILAALAAVTPVLFQNWSYISLLIPAVAGDTNSQLNLGKFYFDKKNWVDSSYWYKKAADQGDKTAICHLGNFYYEGKGFKTNKKIAFDLYMKAAQKECIGAIGNLGMCYKYGQGVEKNDQRAFKYYLKAAKLGLASAQNQTGNCFSNGTGTPKDDVKAVYWYKKAAHQKDRDAQFNLATAYYYGRGIKIDLKKAFNLYKLAAEKNLPEAQYSLAAIYMSGKGVKQDLKKTAYWHRKAAEQNYAKAQLAIGSMYAAGLGVAKNFSKSNYWYKKAADQKMPEAEYSLGVYYEHSNIDSDITKAIYWYQKAADQRNVNAIFKLANLYSSGKRVAKNIEKANLLYEQIEKHGTASDKYKLAKLFDNKGKGPRSIKRAMSLYLDAANQGDENAQLRLGGCYLLGVNVKRNPKSAAYWYQKAASNGSPVAKFRLAKLYRDGNGVGKSLQKELFLISESAKSGHANAQNELGKMYEKGKLVPKDKKLAVIWYQKSAQNGSASGCYNLGLCYENGIGVTKNSELAIKYFQRASRLGYKKAETKFTKLLNQVTTGKPSSIE